MTEPQTFGQQLQKARETAGLSVPDPFPLDDLETAEWIAWEEGRSNPTKQYHQLLDRIAAQQRVLERHQIRIERIARAVGVK